MSNTPEDTELQKEIESFLYITNHSKYYYLRLTQVGHDPAVAGIDLDAHVVIKRILNLITLHTNKARIDELTKHLSAFGLGHILMTKEDVDARIAQLTNPTEAGEK